MNNLSRHDRIIDQLVEVLDLGKQALKVGDFSAMQDITDKQNALITRLEALPLGSDLSPQKIQKLGRHAEQNQRFLMAAKAGILSATRRKRDAGNANEISQTYDRSGHRALLETHPDTFEKHS